VPAVAAAPAANPQHAAAPEPAGDRPANWVAVTAPMVGTFYESPAPNEPPFVQVGDEVAANQTLCIVEAMKLMNEIQAEQMGTIREICVKDADPVEFGTVMFYLEPHNPTPAVGPESV
jgi:oxaloacetate decarboxylase alpha subunit